MSRVLKRNPATSLLVSLALTFDLYMTVVNWI